MDTERFRIRKGWRPVNNSKVADLAVAVSKNDVNYGDEQENCWMPS